MPKVRSGGPYREPEVRRIPTLDELQNDARAYDRVVVPARLVFAMAVGLVLLPCLLYFVGDRDGRRVAQIAVEEQLDQCDLNRQQLVDTQSELDACEREQDELSYEEVTARTESRLTAPPHLLGCPDVLGDTLTQHRCVAFRWQCWRACTGLGEYYAAGDYESSSCVCSGPDGLLSITQDFTQVQLVWPHLSSD